jgi:Icc-related predicted phosphoesterase
MKILAVSDLFEEFAFVDRLPEVIRGAGVDAVVFTGNILRADQREAEWRRALAEGRPPRAEQPEVARERDNDAQSLNRFFRLLSSLGVPACLVPGRTDAPERLFLQAACNAEIVAARVYNVHRSFAPLGSNWIVAGFGGEITEEERDHTFFLRYPGWEAQFSLEFLRHLDQDRILLLHTPPADELEGRPTGGHQIVSHILKTYSPAFAFCASPASRRGKLTLGNTLVVFPGRLADGDYAILDTRERTVAFGDLR